MNWPGDDDGQVLPAWRWDEKRLTLSPRCPVCGERVIASGRRFTCLIVGFRHYDEPVEGVMGEVLGRLGQVPGG
jgi:hypothetical protein